ncbi:MAG: threonylcarbamoyl-AMP synthase [Myxococcales bacterium]|nr:threonylcarbamoyl-AMP synthase [Myxococcales bacterium]MCB9704740.1 threonylcarbamoyl-AMP synthase [Myxococcales bacterium]
MILHIDAERPAPRKLQPVIDALKRDQVVIYPTDTGYAFGCAISSPKAIAVLRRLKGIDERHPKPLTMLVNDIADIGRYAHMGTSLYRLVKRLLPGPYTLVLKATSDTPRTMYNRHHEVGIRIPNHAVCRMLVELLGEPILTGSVSSADGEPELEEADLLANRYAREVSVTIDAGPIWPDPSTVLKMIDDEIEVLREGQGELPF